jgi:hypothetical protein
MHFKFKLLDLFKRRTKTDKRTEVIFNGEDNLYAEVIERLTNNSVTAKTSSKIMASYIIGNGFGEEKDKTIINSETRPQLTLRGFGNIMSQNVSVQRGVWVHAQYNSNFDVDRYNILPYSHCRLGKEDDNDYSGKIVVYDNWDMSQGRINKDDFLIFDVFNPSKEVVEYQIDAAGGIDDYKGQVLYVNLDAQFDYALGTIDATMQDCDSERQASIYKNCSLRRGFYGKTLVVTKPLAGGIEGDHDHDIKERKEIESERKNFKKTMEGFLGAENTGGLLHVEVDHDGDNLDEAFKVERIDSDIDDKMFAFTEGSIFKNILMSFNNIPSGLVRSDNSLFSANGESLEVMKETYQENTEFERDTVEEIINMLMSFFKDDLGELKIIPLISTPKTQAGEAGEVVTSEDDDIKKKAQAALKGSVGGVTALLEIQKSVTDGATDRDSALTIIEEIFGIDRELAGRMLGEVKEEPEEPEKTEDA